MSNELITLKCVRVDYIERRREGQSIWEGKSVDGARIAIALVHDGVDSMDDKIGDELQVTFHD